MDAGGDGGDRDGGSEYVVKGFGEEGMEGWE